MSSQGDGYLLGRGLVESMRLDAQHLLWKLHCGFVLHPRIPISPTLQVAEIGTGTALWLLDLGSELAETVQLDGYDISESQWPHEKLLPSNISLKKLNSLEAVPKELQGKYDVVHLRFWCCIVKGNDPRKLIQHALDLLRPGGYLQWEDAQANRTVAKGAAAESFSRVMKMVFQAVGISFDWLESMNEEVGRGGFSVLEMKTGPFPHWLTPLATKTYLAAHAEMFEMLDQIPDLPIPDKTQREKLLHDLVQGTSRGDLYHWSPVQLLALKPNAPSAGLH